LGSAHQENQRQQKITVDEEGPKISILRRRHEKVDGDFRRLFVTLETVLNSTEIWAAGGCRAEDSLSKKCDQR
jgi:hypothetical protein